MKKILNVILLMTLSVHSVFAQGWTDVTGFITNPGFTNNLSFGWTRDYSGSGVTSVVQYECMEVWNGVCDIRQTLQGLPKGKYRLSVQAFYREASQKNAYPHWNRQTDNITAVLYAGNAEQKLRSNYEYSFTSNVADTCWTPDQQIFYPNGMASTRVAFDEGAYQNTLDFEADGNIEIGIRNNVHEFDNWVIFDNFRLEYMGTITPATDIALNVSKTTLVEGDSAFASAAVLPLNATIQKLSYYSSDPFVFSVNQKGDMIAVGAGSAVLTVMTNDEKVKKEVVVTVEKNQLDNEGTWKEMPNVICNPTFDIDGDNEGWEIERENGTTEVRSGCLEFWNNTHFTTSQVIENLPKGHYRLSVQGYHRYGSCAEDYERLIDNGQTSLAYLFVKGERKALVPYCSYSEIMKPGDEWSSPDNGKHWMPNTMESASEAFAKDAYWNYLEFDVEKEVEDVTIGIGLDEYTKWNWCIFTNFKLETNVEIDLGKTYTLSVQDESGSDISSKVNIHWYDGQGNELGFGASIGGIKKDTELYYSVSLDESLGKQYREVRRKKANLEEETIVCKLQRIEEVALYGKVQAYGTALYRAEINLTQWLNGKYEYTASTLTDANGEFTLSAYNDSTELIVTANGYIDNKVSRRNLNNGGELGTIDMTEVSGKVITLRLSYQEATREGAEPIVQSWYNDTRNIDYSVYNETKGKVIEDYAIQQGNIVLPTGTDRGDNIRITLRSLNKKFSEVTANATIADNDTANVTISLLAFGGIEATYGQKADDNLLAMLYDSTGKLQMRIVSSTSQITFTNLAAGNYSLITMGYNGAIGSIADIADLANMDLAEGTDYVRSTAMVRDGYITSINVASVPELDASKFEYSGVNTSYLPNKMQLVVGNFITMTTRVDFKEQYDGRIDNVKAVVDIPDGCEFVPNSVVIGAKPIPHSLNGNKLIITVAKDDIDRRIRFCVIPTQTGTYMTTAYAEFDYNGMKTQPIGQVKFESTSGELYVPPTARTKEITVGGIGVPKADVEVYDNDALIGTTKSLANGKWSLKCELNKAYNLSTHSIYVKYRGEGNVVGLTETKECFYDKNAIVVKSVTMINTAHPAGNLTPTVYKTVFDFISQTTSPNYYSYWPDYPDFTFLVEFTDNDTTKISNVTLHVYTTSGEIRELTAEYDAKQNGFVAAGSFDSFSLPTNVGVDFNAIVQHTIDGKQLLDAKNDVESYSRSFLSLKDIIDKFYEEHENANSDDYFKLCEQIGLSIDDEELLPIDTTIAEGMSEEEIEAFLETKKNEFEDRLASINEEVARYSSMFQLSDNYELTLGNGYQLVVESSIGMTEVEMLANGYTKLQLTEGGFVYLLTTDKTMTFVNLNENTVVKMTIPTSASKILMNQRRASLPDEFKEVFLDIETARTLVQTINEDFQKRIMMPISVQEKYIKGLERDIQEIKRFINCMCKEGSQAQKFWIKRLKDAEYTLSVAKTALKLSGPLLRLLARSIPILSYMSTLSDCYNITSELQSIYQSIPDPCLNDQKNANWCKAQDITIAVATGMFAIAEVVAEVSADCEILGGAAAALTTGGASLAVSGWGIVQKAIAEMGKCVLTTATKQIAIKELKKRVKELRCLRPNPNPNPTPKPHPNPGGGSGSIPKEDPSGFVYEAVPTNRLEGVKATVYYSEDEYGDFPVMWDAAEYGEINPQITDESGLYAWDVPQGFWKVIFEKDGYETAETEWLPVPPPQLEVNIPMSQAVAPYVEGARGVESGVTLEFSKYMRPNTMTRGGRVTVTVNGKNVDGDVQLLNAEQNPFNKEEYASKIKFVPNTPFKTTDEVIITVKKEAQSYVGMEMTGDFVQLVKIESEITEIVCDSVIAVDYHGAGFLELSVLPAAAAKGKTIQVASTSDMIASTDAQSITLNDEGKARITVSGELPGNASLHLSMPEVGKEKYVAVNVVTKDEDVVKTPKASKPTGSIIEYDYLLTLNSATVGSVIYYTLDGSCPCDEQKRIKYTGPFTLPVGKITLKTIAVREGMADSEIAEYNYQVQGIPLNYYTYESLVQTLDDREGWLELRAQKPNAVAVVESAQSDWASQHQNVLTTNTDGTYSCADFLLADLSRGFGSNASEAAKTGFFTPVSFKVTKGAYERQAYAGYNTLCLPFSFKASDLSSSAKVFTFNSYDADKTKVVFKAVSGTVAAGTPCIVKEKKDVVWTLNLSGKTIEAAQPSEGSHMRGTYVTTDQYQGKGYSPRSSDGKFAPLTQYLHPFRACFSLTDLNAAARGSLWTVFLDEDGVTVIDEINAAGSAADAPKSIYTLSGQRVKEVKRSGLYIVNGEKQYIEVR